MGERVKAKAETTQGFEIVANRDGLLALALSCLQLAMLPEDNAKAVGLGNHVHFAEWAGNLESASDEFIIVYKPDM